MAEGIFSISADITPTADQRQLETQAQAIAKQFNAALAKQIKPIELNASTKNLQKAQGTTKLFSNELIKASKNADGLNNSLNSTDNVLTKMTKTAIDLAQKGFSQITAQLEKISPLASRTFTAARSSVESFVSAGRKGFISVGNAFNLTNTKLIQFTGSIRTAIKDNARFKDALDAVNRSAGAIQRLPQNFKILSSQIVSGTTDLQKAAEKGNSFSKSLLPFLLIGQRVTAELDKVSIAIDRLSRDLFRLQQITAGGKLADPSKSFNVDSLTKVEGIFKNLGKSAPLFAERFQATFEGLRSLSFDDQVKSLNELRKQFKGVQTLGDGTKINLGNQIRSDLFNVAPDVLSVFDRFSERASRFGTTVRGVFKNASDAVSSAFANKFTGKGFFDEANARLKFLQDQGFSTAFSIRQSLAGAFNVSNIGEPLVRARVALKGFGEDVAGVSKAIGTTFKNSITAAEASFNKFTDRVQKGGFKEGVISTFTDIGNAIKKAFGGEGGGERGALGLGFAGGILDAFKGLAGASKGITGALTLPFRAVSTAATAAVGPVKAVGGSILGSIAPSLGVTAGLAAGIGALGVAALHTAAKFEQIETSLNGIFRGNGKAALDEIANFAAVTPFRLETAAQAVIKLSSTFQGLQPGGALAILNQLSGAAAAVGASDDALNRVVLAFTQIQSAGRLTADNLRQITEAIPAISRGKVFDNIAKGLNVTNVQAKKLAEEGLVDSETGLKAVVEAASQVPGAAEALEKQSKTFNGLMSTTKDLFDQFLAKLGAPILRIASGLLAGINVVLTELGRIIPGVIGAVGRFFTDLANKLGVVGDAVKGFLGFLGNLPGVSLVVKGAKEVISGSLQGLTKDTKETTTAVYTLQQALAGLNTVKNAVSGLRAAFKPVLDDLAKLNSGEGFTGNFLGPILNGINKLGPALVDPSDKVNGIIAGFEELASKPITAAILPQLEEFKKVIGTLNLPKEVIDNIAGVIGTFEDQVDKTNAGLTETLNKVIAASEAYKRLKEANEAVNAALKAESDLIKEHNDQVAKDRLRLIKEQDKANKDLAKSTDDVAEAQIKLNEALRPTPIEDLQLAELKLSQSKLRLKKLIEDQAKAQNELNKAESVSVDLTGLSVDEIKTRLSLVRATLKTQKKPAKAAEETPTEKEIGVLQSEIDKRALQIEIRDTEKEIQALREKGSEKDPEVIAARKALADTEERRQEAVEKQVEAQDSLNKLNEIDKEFEKQKAAAAANVASARATAAQAAEDAQIATFKAEGNEEGINRILLDRVEKLGPEAQRQLEKALTNTDQKAAKEQLVNDKLGTQVDLYTTINDLITGATNARKAEEQRQADEARRLFEILFTGPNFPQKLFDDFKKKFFEDPTAALDPNTVNTIQQFVTESFIGTNKPLTGDSARIRSVFIEGLLKPLARDFKLSESKIFGTIVESLRPIVGAVKNEEEFQEKVKEIFRQLGIFVRFAEGGLVTGPTRALIGEAGKEAVLPLTRPARLADVLSNRHVLPPVLAALGRITLPKRNSGVADLSSSIDTPITVPKPGFSGGGTRQEQAKKDSALARAIVEEMKAAGFGGGKQVTVTNDFTAPNANDPLSSLQIRQIAREVKRQIEKEL